MSHSTHAGFSRPPLEVVASFLRSSFTPRVLNPAAISTSSSNMRPPLPLGRVPGLAALGVGHNPDPVPSVSGVEGTSWNNKRLAGVTDGFQVRQTIVECHADDSSNVFTKHPSGSCLFNNPQHLRPEVTVIRRASSLPGDTEWLAGEPTGDEIGPDVLEFADVAEVRHLRPAVFENLAGEGLDLGKADGLEPGLS
jgi:hypothetical protein